jgi:hypothetical protein
LNDLTAGVFFSHTRGSIQVGDELLYVKDGVGERVRVSCVHQDDLPDFYYIIKWGDGSGREKQTVAKHLRVVPCAGRGADGDFL